MADHMELDLDAWSSWDQQAVETLVMLKGSKEQSPFNCAMSKLPPVATKTRKTRSRASSPWLDSSSPSHRERSTSPSMDAIDHPMDQDYVPRQRISRQSAVSRATKPSLRSSDQQLVSAIHSKLAKRRAPSPTNSAVLLESLPLLSAFFAPNTPAASAPARPPAPFSAPASPMHASPSHSLDSNPLQAASSRTSSDNVTTDTKPFMPKRASTPTSDDVSDLSKASLQVPKLPRTSSSILSAIASAAAEAQASKAQPSLPILKVGPPQRRPLPLGRQAAALRDSLSASKPMLHEHSRLSHTVTGMSHLQPVHLLSACPVQRVGPLHVGEAPA